ncbi:hypothetical protein [Curtobacterium sp. MCBD17_040]|uniref:hypothetical protein n=1 Tax=Curtobacterium sp. MCBD17_040 TaxID=2175674 RepID=UPI000DA7FAFC|nr:hypothetical protein [Curtobacterium sp. MCBD17_040]WIB65537.1 hypothetical protein DEI94_19375 [Curtobacterium sp. MCBD17_040]
MKTWTKLMVGAAMVAGLAVAGPAVAAQAATDLPPGSAQSAGNSPLAGTDASAPNTKSKPTDLNSYTDIKCTATMPCLPYQRWQGATQQFHGRFDGWLGTANILYSVQESSATTLITVGNWFFSMAGALLSFASSMSVLKSAGLNIDSAFAALGGVFLNSPIIAAVGVLALGTLLFGYMRGRPPLRRLASTVLIIGLLSAMVAGASADSTKLTESKGTASGCSTVKGFGVLSPGWIANFTDQGVCIISNSFSSTLSSAVQKLEKSQGVGDYADQGRCATYVERLNALATNPKNYSAKSQAEGLVPSQTEVELNDMWESSGLAAWGQAQFGSTPMKTDGSQETEGANVWCHLLDVNANASANQQIVLTFGTKAAADKLNADNIDSAMWGNNTNNSDLDEALVGWAACTPGPEWTVAGGFESASSGNEISRATCTALFSNFDDTPPQLDFPGASSGIVADFNKSSAAADHPAVVSFLENLHGNNLASNGLGVLFAYVLGAIGCIIVFGLIAVVVILAKVATCISLVSLLGVLIMTLLKGTGWDPILKFSKQYVGFAVLSLSMNLLLDLVSLISLVIQAAGNGAFGPGSFLGLLWTGMSPVIAAVALHLMFKKQLGVSPLTPSGALAWGSMAGGVGAVAGAGLVNRIAGAGRTAGGRMTSAATTIKSGAVSAGIGAAGVGGAVAAKGRAGRMAPIGSTPGKGAGTESAWAASAAGGKGAAGAQTRGQRVATSFRDGARAFGAGVKAAPGAVSAGAKAAWFGSMQAARSVPGALKSGRDGLGKAFTATYAAVKDPRRAGASMKSFATAKGKALQDRARSAVGAGWGNVRSGEWWTEQAKLSVRAAARTGQFGVKASGASFRGTVTAAKATGAGVAAVHHATAGARRVAGRAALGAAGGVLMGDVAAAAKGAAFGAHAGHKVNMAKRGQARAAASEAVVTGLSEWREDQLKPARENLAVLQQRQVRAQQDFDMARARLDSMQHSKRSAERNEAMNAFRKAESALGNATEQFRGAQDAFTAHERDTDAEFQRRESWVTNNPKKKNVPWRDGNDPVGSSGDAPAGAKAAPSGTAGESESLR